MSIDQSQIQEFMSFFSGSLHNYGEFTYEENPKLGEKTGTKIKGTGRTVTNKLVTLENYKNHLDGEKGLGVIPIDNNKCSFYIIDVDIYDVDFSVYMESIERHSFPLVPFRSKSGGLHLYLFLKEKEGNIKRMREIMSQFVSLLSIDSLLKEKNKELVEIFPKQIFLKAEDVGNWINLPYYDAKRTTQYALRDNKALSLVEALSLIKQRQTSLVKLEEFLDNLNFNDAPPCLQKIYLLNDLKAGDGRNNFLFSFGIYLKKKNETLFECNLAEVNNSLRYPVDSKELETTILNSLRKKDYLYKCREHPCASFCNKEECKQREFGIGKQDGYFSSMEFGQLFQFKTYSPYYEWEIRLQGEEEWKVLRFKSEEEIIKQDVLLRLCMRELKAVPAKIKQNEWLKVLNHFLKEMIVQEVNDDEDTSHMVLFKSFLLEFLTGRIVATQKTQLLMSRVYFEEKDKEYWFRTKDLMHFLYNEKQFRYVSPQEVHGILREMGCGYRTIRTEKRQQVRIAFLRESSLNSLKEGSFQDPSFEVVEEGF